MNTSMTNEQAAQIEAAKKELVKLPLLGPALWLYARDQRLRFTSSFIADLDWRLMPPLVLDQCRLYSKVDVPWAFVTWAFVNETVDQRLRSSSPVIAPHEWKGGDTPWLIDVVAPFGDAEAMALQAAQELGAGKTVTAWMPGPGGQPILREFAPRG